ncbi:MAG: NAD(P)-dependent oxidoreductase [Gammaproteobacteria bacterium]
MRILVTGATGFVGSHLVPRLINDGATILEITIDPVRSAELYGDSISRFVYEDNINDLNSIVGQFNPEIVIHLASYLTSADDTDSMKKLIQSNVLFLCVVLDALKQTSLKLFVNVGSFAEYYRGDGVLSPAYLYTATKTASRAFVDYYSEVYGFNYVTVVPYTIYGGKDSQKKIIDVLYDSLYSRDPVSLSGGDQILDFIHVNDLVDFFMTIVDNIEVVVNKSVFHVGSGVGHSLKQIAHIIESITNKKTCVLWGGIPYRPRDVMYAVANIAEQYHQFRWRPKISIEEGIRIYVQKKGDN